MKVKIKIYYLTIAKSQIDLRWEQNMNGKGQDVSCGSRQVGGSMVEKVQICNNDVVKNFAVY